MLKLIFRTQNNHIVHSEEEIQVKHSRMRKRAFQLWKRTKRVKKNSLLYNGTCGSYLFSFRLSVMWMYVRHSWGLARYFIEKANIFLFSALSLSAIVTRENCHLIFCHCCGGGSSVFTVFRVHILLSMGFQSADKRQQRSFFSLDVPKGIITAFTLKSNASALVFFLLCWPFSPSKFVYRITGNKLNAFRKTSFLSAVQNDICLCFLSMVFVYSRDIFIGHRTNILPIFSPAK